MTPNRFFWAGGTLRDGAFSLRRAADDELFAALQQGHATVVAPRQYGKTTLARRAAQRLREQGGFVAWADMSVVDAARPKKAVHSIADRLLDDLAESPEEAAQRYEQFRLFYKWVEGSPAHRLVRFLQSYRAESGAFWFFLDEFDALFVRHPAFADDLLSAVRLIPPGSGLTFCLIGVFAPEENPGAHILGHEIVLSDFARSELEPLAAGLADFGPPAEELLDEVFRWTHGHPYLTQFLCDHLARGGPGISNARERVGTLVQEHFLSPLPRDVPILLHIEGLFSEPPAELREMLGRMLGVYAAALQSPLWGAQRGPGPKVPVNYTNPEQVALSRLGLTRAEGEPGQQYVAPRSKVHASVFDLGWVAEKARRLLGPALALLVLLCGLALPAAAREHVASGGQKPPPPPSAPAGWCGAQTIEPQGEPGEKQPPSPPLPVVIERIGPDGAKPPPPPPPPPCRDVADWPQPTVGQITYVWCLSVLWLARLWVRAHALSLALCGVAAAGALALAAHRRRRRAALAAGLCAALAVFAPGLAVADPPIGPEGGEIPAPPPAPPDESEPASADGLLVALAALATLGAGWQVLRTGPRRIALAVALVAFVPGLGLAEPPENPDSDKPQPEPTPSTYGPPLKEVVPGAAQAGPDFDSGSPNWFQLPPPYEPLRPGVIAGPRCPFRAQLDGTCACGSEVELWHPLCGACSKQLLADGQCPARPFCCGPVWEPRLASADRPPMVRVDKDGTPTANFCNDVRPRPEMFRRGWVAEGESWNAAGDCPHGYRSDDNGERCVYDFAVHARISGRLAGCGIAPPSWEEMPGPEESPLPTGPVGASIGGSPPERPFTRSPLFLVFTALVTAWTLRTLLRAARGEDA